MQDSQKNIQVQFWSVYQVLVRRGVRDGLAVSRRRGAAAGTLHRVVPCGGAPGAHCQAGTETPRPPTYMLHRECVCVCVYTCTQGGKPHRSVCLGRASPWVIRSVRAAGGSAPLSSRLFKRSSCSSAVGSLLCFPLV